MTAHMEDTRMGSLIAGITVSVDGYFVGPDDGPGQGLGAGGERLHNWVFGGPWRYGDDVRGEPVEDDKAWLAKVGAGMGAVIGGRHTYEAAGHWGDRNPWGLPFFIVTHHPKQQPPGDDFIFVGSLDEAVTRAREAAGEKDVHLMGGGDLIRQALEAGVVDELTIIVAPVILGGGKRLFKGFTRSIDLEQIGARQSRFATFVDYRVAK